MKLDRRSLPESALAGARFDHAGIPFSGRGFRRHRRISGRLEDAAGARCRPRRCYKTLCARCHGEKGDGNGKVAWYLDPAPRDLTKAGFMNSKPRARFLDSIGEGVAGTSMPAWGACLKDDQIRRCSITSGQHFVKEPAQRIQAAQGSRDESGAGDARVHHARRAHLPRALHRLPRPQSRRQGTQLDGYPAASAQSAESLVSWTACRDRRLFESILYGVQGTAMPSWIDYG